MHVNELLECRSKIIKAFKDGTFRSEHLKEADDAAYKYVLKDVNTFIEEIRSMEEKINLSSFKEFFDHSSPADYKKYFLILKTQTKIKKM